MRPYTGEEDERVPHRGGGVPARPRGPGRGTSQADVIRKAILAYVPEGAGDRDFVSARVADGPGGSIADVPEEDLLKGFGER